MFVLKSSHRFTVTVAMAAFFIYLFSSCSLKSKVPTELRQLDSLHIVLQSKLSQLKQMDTVLLEKAVKRFQSYSDFLEHHVKDTLLMEEATALQQFYLNGRNLKNFSQNRPGLMARMHLVSSQVARLKTDTENNALRYDEFILHFTTETKALTDLIRIGERELELYSESLSAFKSNLPPTEALIKKRNNGLLPAEVSTASSL